MSRTHLTLFSSALALAIGAIAHIAPPIAVLLLAVLGARALAAGVFTTRVRAIDILAPLAAAAIVGAVLGLAAAVGSIFVWRLAADARFSIEEDRRLNALAGWTGSALSRAHLTTSPALGLALVAFTAPHMVAGLPLDLPHVPLFVPVVAGIVAALAIGDWAIRRLAEWRLGMMAQNAALHQLSHHVIFLGAYVISPDVSAGLCMVLAWRLAQVQPRAVSVQAAS